MRRMITIAFFAAFLAASVANAEVRLMLDESTVLPGTPTGFTIVVTNSGKTPLQLPPALWLIATDEDVETFRVSASSVSDGAGIFIPEEQRAVPPGGSREFRYDPSPVLVASPWFTDGRLSKPGLYRLRAVFAPSVALNGDFNAAHALASKEELLTIAVDSDDDASVWEWMKAKGGGKWGQGQWMTHPFAEFVMKNYPRSSYALYAVILLPVEYHDQKDQLLAEQVKRFPQKSYSDQLKLQIVQNHQRAASILRRSDVRAAADEADAARRLASELAETSHSSEVRRFARELLARTPTREQLMQNVKAQ